MSRLHLGPPHVNGAAAGTHAPRKNPKRRAPKPKLTRKAQLYAAMVAAVRAWVHEADPDAILIDVCKADPARTGVSYQIACFHALNPDDDYARGDLAAIGLVEVPDLRDTDG